MKLNLGCGPGVHEGWVNVDIVAHPGVQVHDLNVTPWPWPDNSAEVIAAKDIFEHVDQPVSFITECHRVLRPGAQLGIQTAWWMSETAYTDPTHKRFCTEHTFDYWIPGRKFGEVELYGMNAFYGGVAFELVEMKTPPESGTELCVVLRKPGARL